MASLPFCGERQVLAVVLMSITALLFIIARHGESITSVYLDSSSNKPGPNRNVSDAPLAEPPISDAFVSVTVSKQVRPPNRRTLAGHRKLSDAALLRGNRSDLYASFAPVKTGSTATVNIFRSVDGVEILHRHEIDKLSRELASVSLDRPCWLIASVRNPFAQIISAYFQYLKTRWGEKSYDIARGYPRGYNERTVAGLIRAGDSSVIKILADGLHYALAQCRSNRTDAYDGMFYTIGAAMDARCRLVGTSESKCPRPDFLRYVCTDRFWSVAMSTVSGIDVLDFADVVRRDKHVAVSGGAGARCAVVLFRLEEAPRWRKMMGKYFPFLQNPIPNPRALARRRRRLGVAVGNNQMARTEMGGLYLKFAASWVWRESEARDILASEHSRFYTDEEIRAFLDKAQLERRIDHSSVAHARSPAMRA